MNQDPAVRAAIEGRVGLGPDVLRETMALLRRSRRSSQRAARASSPRCTGGAHARYRTDVYVPSAAGSGAPILVWVHGGGFVRGDKKSSTDPYNAHFGHWAARHGYIGVVMNYRLAPEFRWPCGGEDVGAVVDWLRRDAARYGGDPDRIVLVGSSAGAVHIATYLQLRPRPSASEVRGAVLLSGSDGLTPLESVDRLYFGDGDQAIPKPSLLEAVAGSAPPVFVACAEFDPPRFQREAVALLERTLRARGRLPRTHFASGHNHYTLAMHLGTSDTRLADELLDFARACCAGESSRLPSRPIEERQTS
jgi:triacylglycerol lipase